jgi:hypothetical protein
LDYKKQRQENMNKIILKLLLISFTSSNLLAVDYNIMSIEELRNLRGTITQENRDDFRKAMQSKMLSLTYEQRALIMSANHNCSTHKTNNCIHDMQKISKK